MEKEINIKELLLHLKKESEETKVIADLKKDFEIFNLANRPFNKDYTWHINTATYFIESILLGCETNSIVLLQYNNQYIVCDGLNRLNALVKFLNNELKLTYHGLAKLKKIAGMKYNKFSEQERYYFEHHIHNRVITYKIDLNREIKEEEIIEVAKQLYIRYNTGINLKTEEIENAKYEEEEISKYFKQKLVQEEGIIEKYRKIYLGKKQNKIQSIMVDIRLLIASTYSPIISYCKCRSKFVRNDQYYLESLKKDTTENIISLFENTINYIETIVNSKYFEQYPEFQNCYFIQTLYWTISIVIKEKILEEKGFDEYDFLKYLIEHKDSFVTKQAHYTIYAIERYRVAARYLEKKYGLNIKKYFAEEEAKERKNEAEMTILEPKYKSFLQPRQISYLLDEFKSKKSIVRPSYQRYEVTNIVASSRLLESSMLNIDIPYIIIYERVINNELISEVVDGQQRLLSYISYFGSTYQDMNGIECKSNKNLFALQGLNVLSDKNGLTIDELKKSDETLINKIKSQKIPVLYIKESDNPHFDPRDHFVRLNSNLNHLKNDFYRWNVAYDKKIINAIKKVAKKYEEKIFPKNDKWMRNEMFITNLAYAEYSKERDNSKLFLNKLNVDKWLNDFEAKKNSYIITQENKIEELRNRYLNSIKKIDLFLEKIELWLTEKNLDLSHIFVSNSSNRFFTNYNVLFKILYRIESTDLGRFTKEIIELLRPLFLILKDRTIPNKDKEFYLKKVQNSIKVYDKSQKLKSLV